MDGSYSTDKSEFNMAIAMLRRIDGILTYCTSQHLTKNFPDWFDGLLILSSEINYSFSKDEDAKELEFLNIIGPLLKEFTQRMNFNATNGKYTIRDISSYDNYAILYTAILEYEKFLKKCLYQRDMLAKIKKDPRRAVADF